MKTARRILVLKCMLFAMSGIGCDRPSETEEPATTDTVKQPGPALPADLWVTAAPSGARGVAEIKADPTATDDVVIRGRIGGRVEPFVDGAAVFLLADVSMKHCGELHGDTCKTPWDYCCEPRDALAANLSTIQVVGADGKPLRITLKGEHGLEPLARLTIAGEVASPDGSPVLVINARSIYVHPETS